MRDEEEIFPDENEIEEDTFDTDTEDFLGLGLKEEGDREEDDPGLDFNH